MLDRGVYQLTITLARPARIRIGRLGVFVFPAGRYVYCGSAQRGLAARIARHRRKLKPLRWHVDYILAHPAARVTAVEVFRGAKEGECALARRARREGGAVVVAGFGSSDCTNGCRAHLLWMGEALE
jgi:Uri superfamily endonuclease